jgi:hypothetical protein
VIVNYAQKQKSDHQTNAATKNLLNDLQAKTVSYVRNENHVVKTRLNELVWDANKFSDYIVQMQIQNLLIDVQKSNLITDDEKIASLEEKHDTKIASLEEKHDTQIASLAGDIIFLCFFFLIVVMIAFNYNHIWRILRIF